MKKRYKKNFGFTIVELLVIIAIMGIMLAVGMISLTKGSSDAKIISAQREVASAIRTAKSYALQGKTVSGNAPMYWGFKFTNDTSYEIFSNDGSSDTQREAYTLSNGVKRDNPASAADTRVIFSVPNGDISFSSGSSLNLNLNLGTSNKAVGVASGGVVTEN
jgi:type II secretory pathway pseudopilin PulG